LPPFRWWNAWRIRRHSRCLNPSGHGALKPAPTRLRLLLWALSRGYAEFPESPPPGLVTIPATEGPDSAARFTMAGYRIVGERAVRVDMLERLADLLRLEENLMEKLGARVAIQHTAKGKGRLVINCGSVAELEGILAHIN